MKQNLVDPPSDPSTTSYRSVLRSEKRVPRIVTKNVFFLRVEDRRLHTVLLTPCYIQEDMYKS